MVKVGKRKRGRFALPRMDYFVANEKPGISVDYFLVQVLLFARAFFAQGFFRQRKTGCRRDDASLQIDYAALSDASRVAMLIEDVSCFEIEIPLTVLVDDLFLPGFDCEIACLFAPGISVAGGVHWRAAPAASEPIEVAPLASFWPPIAALVPFTSPPALAIVPYAMLPRPSALPAVAVFSDKAPNPAWTLVCFEVSPALTSDSFSMPPSVGFFSFAVPQPEALVWFVALGLCISR